MHTPTELAKGIRRTYTPAARMADGHGGPGAAPASACNISALQSGVRDAADCEVREMSADSGWQEWQDSAMVDEFAATVPMAIQPSAPVQAVTTADVLDPFASVTRRSA